MTAFRLRPERAAWRIVDGRALVVGRASGALHRLDRVGTEIWHILVGASPEPVEIDALVGRWPPTSISAKDVESFLCELELAGLLEGRTTAAAATTTMATVAVPFTGAARSRLVPRQRRIADTWELAFEVEATPAALARRVGAGFLLRTPDGVLEMLAAEAALVWDLVSSAPRTFVELLEAVCERSGGSYQAAERIVMPLLAAWTASGAIRGLEQIEAVRRAVPTEDHGALGRLDLMRLAASPATPPRIGGTPTLHDASSSHHYAPPSGRRAASGHHDAASIHPIAPSTVEHVAIVCQYGIQGLAPGVEPYTQRCIERLRALEPDLVILSGGGRHGLSHLREAESVIERYRALLPERALWLERHSETTWENLQRSLELLLARSIVPRRITLLGDRARAEKLRLACWLARRRFAPFRAVDFRVFPVQRPRFTWKDRRAVQVVVGIAQVVKESRGAGLAVGYGHAG